MSREELLNREGYYTEDQVAKILGIEVRTLRNRHVARKNHPPRTPDFLYPMKDFHDWNKNRLERQRAG